MKEVLILKSTAENLLLWEQRIKEKVESKMTVEEWCKRNNFSKHQYNYWAGRLHQKQKTVAQMPFAEITPILSNNGNGKAESVPPSDFQIFIHDIRLIVPSDFQPESLAGLLKVLRAV